MAVFSVRSDTDKVLRLVGAYREISMPRLAAKTKMSSEELDSLVQNLSAEGVVRVRLDDIGFEHVALIEEGGPM